MLGCTIRTNQMRGSFARWSEEFNAGLFQVHRMAARRFLSSLISGYNGNFPVYTGCAKASLKPLARYLNMEPLIKIVPVADPHLNEEFGYFQSPETGEEMGEPDRPFLTEDHNMHGIYRVTFYWRTLVDHFNENDIYHVPRVKTPTPWKFVERASEEFKDTIDEFIKFSVPGLEKFILTVSPHSTFDAATQQIILDDDRNIAADGPEGVFGEF